MTIKTLFITFGQDCDVEIYKMSDMEDVTFTSAHDIRVYPDPLFNASVDSWYFENGRICIFIY